MIILMTPLANSATCSKAKIGSKAEEASRPKKSCCCFTKFPELIFKSCFLSVATDEYQEEPSKMEFSWMKNSKSIAATPSSQGGKNTSPYRCRLRWGRYRSTTSTVMNPKSFQNPNENPPNVTSIAGGLWLGSQRGGSTVASPAISSQNVYVKIIELSNFRLD